MYNQLYYFRCWALACKTYAHIRENKHTHILIMSMDSTAHRSWHKIGIFWILNMTLFIRLFGSPCNRDSVYLLLLVLCLWLSLTVQLVLLFTILFGSPFRSFSPSTFYFSLSLSLYLSRKSPTMNKWSGICVVPSMIHAPTNNIMHFNLMWSEDPIVNFPYNASQILYSYRWTNHINLLWLLLITLCCCRINMARVDVCKYFDNHVISHQFQKLCSFC